MPHWNVCFYHSKEIQANTGKGISFHLLILNGFFPGPITQFEHLLPRIH